MLPRGVDWQILSHCDAQAAIRYVESGDREAEPILRVQSDEAF